ncbi:MAG: TonB-dependent receptor [Acidobacteria bacterium]|nr:TonB-dependent receptor [Acidobacteriota bacterium]
MYRIKLLASVLVSVFWFSGVVLAQVTTGTISGTVADSTGAVIPGATVIVRNTETGSSRTVTTDARGRYNASQLGLGMYEVTAETAGFQSVVRSGIEMTIGRQAVVDFNLQVGAVAERITVTGEAPLLETTTATVANLVTEREMRELPLNGRSFTDLTAIQPGAITDLGIPSGVFQGGGRIVLNGARPQQSSYLLDGTDIVSPYSNVAPVSVMNQTLGVDTIREFNVLQSNYSAQYGRAIGGIVNAVTRSGTNEFHGSVFEFLRNEKLDAKNFFDLPDEPIPPYKRNQFGGTIGGPIVKDRTFFFFSYEGLRQILGTTDFGSVLSEETRVGQITACPGGLSTCTKEQRLIVQTVTVNPDIKPIIDIQPLPPPDALYRGTSAANGGSQDFRGSRTQPGRENYYMFRIDQRVSDNDNIFGRMVIDNSSKELSDAQFLDRAKGIHTSTNDWGFYTFLTMEWTRIISPSVLNVARFGFARNNNNQCMCYEGAPRTNADDYPGLAPQLEIIPGVRWGGPWGGIGAAIPGGHNGPGATTNGADLDDPLSFIDNTFSYFDSVRVTKGRHSLDLGVDIRRFQENELVTVWGHGSTSFFSPIKNFLTGGVLPYCTGPAADCRGISSITTTGVTGKPDVYRGWRQTYSAWYVQDDVQLRSNLTLNLGLRWENITSPREVNGKAATFKDLLTAKGWDQLGKEPLFQIRDGLKGMAPRFGFAYSPDEKTSVRGGFGAFKELPLEYLFQLAVFYPPDSERLVLRDIKKWPQPMAGADPTVGSRQPLTVVYDFKEPYGLQWNFSLQRQIGETWVASASYIGTRGVNLVAVMNLVQPAYAKDANGELFTPLRAPSINPFIDSTRTYQPMGDSIYNSMQLRLQKRFSHGVEFGGSYTWSKNLSNVGIGLKGAEQPGTGGGFEVGNLWDYKGTERGRADQDAPHNFVFNYTYELPIGQGRTFGANLGGVGNAILGGWQFNGIISGRSGLPSNISGGGYSTSNYCRTCSVRPNLKPGGDNNPVIGDINHWFDETQFTLVTPGYRGNLGKNTLSAPGSFRMDFSVFKAFQLGEAKSLQFRAEFFNLPNHPNFGGPSTGVFDTNARPVATPGRITSTNGNPRLIQLALKFEF